MLQFQNCIRSQDFWYFFKKVQEKQEESHCSNSSPWIIISDEIIPLPFFLDKKGPKNHGDEDHFEAICGSVAAVSETRSCVAQTPETTVAPLAGWRTKWSSRPGRNKTAYTIYQDLKFIWFVASNTALGTNRVCAASSASAA